MSVEVYKTLRDGLIDYFDKIIPTEIDGDVYIERTEGGKNPKYKFVIDYEGDRNSLWTVVDTCKNIFETFIVKVICNLSINQYTITCECIHQKTLCKLPGFLRLQGIKVKYIKSLEIMEKG